MDVVDAFAWCKKAAENGVVNAMNCVGSFYRNGEGVMKDVKKAAKWYERFAMGGNEYAAFNLAYLYDKGEDGFSADNSKAFIWYKRAAEMGHATAMNNLACAYDNGDGTPQNYELAGY